MSELKPCPFCGGKAETWVEFVPYATEYTYDEKNLYHCGCKRCRIHFSCFWLKDGAINAWDRMAHNANDFTPQKDDFSKEGGQ